MSNFITLLLIIGAFITGFALRGLIQIMWARSANATNDLREYRRGLNLPI